MKKNYFLLGAFFMFSFTLIAQAVIIDTDFSEASYADSGVQADLNNHADWRADHFTNNSATATWNANTNNQILTGANFAYSINATPITGVNGDVITITSIVMLGFDNQAFDTTQDRSMALIGLSPEAAPTASSVLGQQREGVVVQTKIAGTVEMTNAGGTGTFATVPSITQADKSAYEIIIEYTLGADAASSSKTVRIRNVGVANHTSSVVAHNSIRAEVYNAITGSGAYYFNWALQFYQSGAGNINRIVNNRVNVTRNIPVLAVTNHNGFDFAIFPNPVKNVIKINSLETIDKAEIIDLLGRTVQVDTNINNEINVSNLNKSVYILKLTSGNGVSTKKFIKE